MNRAIYYKGVWLKPGTAKHRLHQDKNIKQLDRQLKSLEKQERALVLRAKEVRSLVLEISARHSFTAANQSGSNVFVIGSKTEGFDPDFMKLLEAGAHLDLERMPL